MRQAVATDKRSAEVAGAWVRGMGGQGRAGQGRGGDQRQSVYDLPRSLEMVQVAQRRNTKGRKGGVERGCGGTELTHDVF